jgi:uncharacterized protein YchJ
VTASDEIISRCAESGIIISRGEKCFIYNKRPGLWLPTTEQRTVEPQIGRNDPCPYGSGKKYKKCCLR